MWLTEGSGSGGGGIWSMVLPLVAMFAIFYFLLIRPQQKKQRHHSSMLNALKKGDKIVTAGGLHGVISEITDDNVVLKVNDVTKLTFERSSISRVVSRSEVKEEA
ncbi:MAG: preprotein translocase subunit YajC [Candidatus Cohnella colombiensis]|uniref:Preprotein translocase subunit YajC n=1 Tax=Candidatus Cohnella colombiensis TaxID=3121368 RepID=A0AA95EXM6_9BACL|nr:MAG: preprotein translocase subunit YajC [Cohnella sp.]